MDWSGDVAQPASGYSTEPEPGVVPPTPRNEDGSLVRPELLEQQLIFLCRDLIFYARTKTLIPSDFLSRASESISELDLAFEAEYKCRATLPSPRVLQVIEEVLSVRHPENVYQFKLKGQLETLLAKFGRMTGFYPPEWHDWFELNAAIHRQGETTDTPSIGMGPSYEPD